MLNAMAGGLVPFLISWGGTEHPASSAPQGLTVQPFHVEHPDPPSLAPLLAALGADVEVKPATNPALVAHLSGPNGDTVLRGCPSQRSHVALQYGPCRGTCAPAAGNVQLFGGGPLVTWSRGLGLSDRGVRSGQLTLRPQSGPFSKAGVSVT
jgi:hypothetical protein